jgi:DNA/RNA endonuclease YhcR with UshA esterase domain
MRTLVPALVLTLGLAVAAPPAHADNIAPTDAQKHVGESVTVEGPVGDVHHLPSAKVTFVDIGGRYPDNAFTAVILQADAKKFPDVDKLEGKTVEITGQINLYKGHPQIILNDPAQLKAK